jgi:hypothetical protein
MTTIAEIGPDIYRLCTYNAESGLQFCQFQFRFQQTPHVPHCWDAGLLFEATHAVLLCSDLLLQRGKRSDLAPITDTDVFGPAAAALSAQHDSSTGDGMPYTTQTDVVLDGLAVARFANGREIEADVVVGADGIRSTVRTSMFGEDSPRFTGKIVYRTDPIPVDEVPGGAPSSDSHLWLGPHARGNPRANGLMKHSLRAPA